MKPTQRLDTGPTPWGPAMRTVRDAFNAISERRFDDLAAFVAPDIDWRALPDETGETPRCNNRRQALARIQIGMLANNEVKVKAFTEYGSRVLAHVEPTGEDRDDPPPARFLVIEVDAGQINRMTAYATELEAQTALHAEA